MACAAVLQMDWMLQTDSVVRDAEANRNNATPLERPVRVWFSLSAFRSLDQSTCAPFPATFHRNHVKYIRLGDVATSSGEPESGSQPSDRFLLQFLPHCTLQVRPVA